MALLNCRLFIRQDVLARLSNVHSTWLSSRKSPSVASHMASLPLHDHDHDSPRDPKRRPSTMTTVYSPARGGPLPARV